MTDTNIFLTDSRVNCLSGIGVIQAGEYLELIEGVYKKDGGIPGQRAPLKTKTAINIRKRMVEDIESGTILPPIVIGAVVSDKVFESAKACTTNDGFVCLMKSLDLESLSIIDGMQRTTALWEASGKVSSQDKVKDVRIDLWLARSVGSLVYRMLVLNTGQVAWDIRRQLETIYKHILEQVKKQIPDISVFNIDAKDRRSSAGQYRSTRIIELFLAFTSRKPHIELKEKVAEDFARMEATEATANERALPAFVVAMELLAKLDTAFAACSIPAEFEGEGTRFKEGKDIFTSAPASIGFAAAASQFLLGKPGYPFAFESLEAKQKELIASVEAIILKLRAAKPPEDFIDFLTLNEKISAKSGRIGEFEREFFFRAFSHMIENAKDLTSLSPCWFSYR